MLPRVLQRQGWSSALLLGALAITLAAAAITWQAWADIFRTARDDEEASHIFLVPVVAAWMFVVRQARFQRCPPGGGIVGSAIVLFGWALSSYGYRNGVESFWHGGSVLVVVGAAVTMLGKHVLFQFFPAFAVLAFLVPVPGRVRQEISMPLMEAGAWAAQRVLEAIGADVERAGNVLSCNGQKITVAEACNGMRMVFALALVTYAFAFGMPLRGYVRAIILALSPVVALLINIPRLVGTVYAYGYGSKELGDKIHDASAWIMPGLAFLVLLAIYRLLRWAMLPVARYNLAYQ